MRSRISVSSSMMRMRRFAVRAAVGTMQAGYRWLVTNRCPGRNSSRTLPYLSLPFLDARSRPRRRGRRRPGRQQHVEGRAAAELAVEGDGAVHGLDQVLDDRESEAGAAAIARASGVYPIEALEDTGRVLGRDPRSAVLDRDPHLVAVGAAAQRDHA